MFPLVVFGLIMFVGIGVYRIGFKDGVAFQKDHARENSCIFKAAEKGSRGRRKPTDRLP